MTNLGLKISKEDKTAFSSNNQELLLSSDLPFFKTFMQGQFSLNITGAGTFTNTIDHNLGYHPAFMHLQAVNPNNPERRYLGRFAAQSGADFIGVDSYTTRTTLTIAWYDNSAAPGGFKAYPYVITFYYYIFYDPLENI